MRLLRALTCVAAAVWLAPLAARAEEAPAARLTFDPTTTFQTMEGWGVALPCWLGDKTVRDGAAYDRGPERSEYSEALNEALAADLVERGFNRFRLEVGFHVEFENDNADPNVLDMRAFRFKWQDAMVREQLLPMKRLLDARGEPTVLYMSYDLGSARSPAWLLEPEEYAEMAVATLTHLKEAFGLKPAYWSVLNEPANGRPGSPKLCAELTAATGRRIAQAGFKTRMSGPECVTPKQADAYLKAMVDTPQALDRFAQITYHLYWDPETIEHRRTIRDWARKLKVTAAQTEWMEQRDLDVARHIFLCLTEADVVAWERYAWDVKTDVKAGTFARESTAWYVRQFSRFIRPGAVRVGLTGSDAAVKGVAFLSPRKKPVIVVINADGRPRPVRIAGLPAGDCAVSYTAPEAEGKALPDASVRQGEDLALDLPARSVVTLTADPPAPGPRQRAN